MADELGRAAGREVGEREAAVALGRLDAGAEREGAEAAQAEAGRQVVVALLLAGVAGHGGADRREPPGDVDQQVGVGRVVDLVDQHREGAGEGRQGVVGAGGAAGGGPQSTQQAVEGGEGRPVIGRDLEGRGHQDEVGLGLEQALAEGRGQVLEMIGEAAVGQVEVACVARLQAGEGGEGGRRLRAPARGVGAGRLAAADPAGAVAQVQHPDPRAGRRELADQPAAAEHLVVVMGGEDEHAPGVDRGGLSRGQEVSPWLGSAVARFDHWTYPRASSPLRVSGLAAAAGSLPPA